MRQLQRIVVFALALLSLAARAGAEDPSADDPEQILKKFVTNMGLGEGHDLIIDGPPISDLRRRGVDIVPVLFKIIRDRDVSYAYRYAEPKGWYDGAEELGVRHSNVTNAAHLLQETRDPRAGRFFVELCRDRTEPYVIRNEALGSLECFLDLPETHELYLEILRPADGAKRNESFVGYALHGCKEICRSKIKGNWTDLADAWEEYLEYDKTSTETNEATKRTLADCGPTLVKNLRELTDSSSISAPDRNGPPSEASEPSSSPKKDTSSPPAAVPSHSRPASGEWSQDFVPAVIAACTLALLAALCYLFGRHRGSDRGAPVNARPKGTHL